MTQTKLNKECEGCSWCCEHLLVPLTPHEGVVKFHVEWGNKIKLDRNGMPWSVIHKPCKNLGDDGFCQVYDHPEKPVQCNNYPHHYQKIYWDDCALMRATIKPPEKEEPQKEKE